MIGKTVATILLLGSLVVPSVAQHPGEVRIDATNPTVYLAFERLGDDDSVWLRLHNNSHWAISFRTENQGTSLAPLRLSDGRVVNGLADGLQVAPEYVIENLPDQGRRIYWCTSADSWLAPGLSTIFSFPREDLKPVGRIKVSFTYEWEGPGKEPEHRVDFSEFELKNSLTQISP
jgi:hypothetical protein